MVAWAERVGRKVELVDGGYIASRSRHNLGLDHVPAGVSGDPARPDNIIFDIADDAGGNPESAGGFGHPHCGPGTPANETNIANNLPAVP